jgi:hypothetical protein
MSQEKISSDVKKKSADPLFRKGSEIDYATAPIFPVESNEFFGRGIQPHLARRRTRTELNQILEREERELDALTKKSIVFEMDKRNKSVAKDNQGQITTAMVRELIGGFIHRQGRMWVGQQNQKGNHQPDILQPVREPDEFDDSAIGWNSIEVKSAHTRNGVGIRPSQMYGYLLSMHRQNYSNIVITGNTWAYIRYHPTHARENKQSGRKKIIKNDRISEEQMLQMYANGTRDLLIADIPIQLLLFSLAPHYRTFTKDKKERIERTVKASTISTLLYRKNGLEELIQQAQTYRKMSVPDVEFIRERTNIEHYKSPEKQYFWFPAFYKKTLADIEQAIDTQFSRKQMNTQEQSEYEQIRTGLAFIAKYYNSFKAYLEPRIQLKIKQFPITLARMSHERNTYRGLIEFTEKMTDYDYFHSWIRFAGLQEEHAELYTRRKIKIQQEYEDDEKPF